MKIDMLKEALNMLYARGDYDLEIKAEIKSALEELQTTMDLWGDRADNYELEVRLVPEESMVELININLYNMYGRMMRQNRNLVEFDLFVSGCRGGSVYADGFEYLSDKALRGGYEFIRDLWQDNESNGNNNPDGTFNDEKTLTASESEVISDLICDYRDSLAGCVDDIFEKMQTILNKLRNI